MGWLDEVLSGDKGQAYLQCNVPYFCDQEARVKSHPGTMLIAPEFGGVSETMLWPCNQWTRKVYWDSAAKNFNVWKYHNSVTKDEFYTVNVVEADYATSINLEAKDIYTRLNFMRDYPQWKLFTRAEEPGDCFTEAPGPMQEPIYETPSPVPVTLPTGPSIPSNDVSKAGFPLWLGLGMSAIAVGAMYTVSKKKKGKKSRRKSRSGKRRR